MQNLKPVRATAEQMLPLLRSISAEMQARTRAIERLEQQLATLAGAPVGDRDALRLAHSELATHRRELRAIEKELGRLGFSIDADNPWRIVGPGSTNDLGGTRFRLMSA
jgi:hypothetical protein